MHCMLLILKPAPAIQCIWNHFHTNVRHPVDQTGSYMPRCISTINADKLAMVSMHSRSNSNNTCGYSWLCCCCCAIAARKCFNQPHCCCCFCYCPQCGASSTDVAVAASMPVAVCQGKPRTHRKRPRKAISQQLPCISAPGTACCCCCLLLLQWLFHFLVFSFSRFFKASICARRIKP